MKSIVDYIVEARVDNSPYKNAKTTLHFASVAAALLYLWEFSGQISDGKYENAKPSYHWEWMNRNLKIVVDGKEGYEGPVHVKKYSFADFVKGAFGKDNKNDFAIRDLYYVAMANEYDEKDLNNPNIDYDRSLIETYFETLAKNPDITFEKIKERNKNYNYLLRAFDNAIKANTPEFFNKCKETKLMDESDFKKLVKSATSTINTSI